jgi:hypothetical protein
MSFNGRTSASQAENAGSIPVIRSNYISAGQKWFHETSPTARSDGFWAPSLIDPSSARLTDANGTEYRGMQICEYDAQAIAGSGTSKVVRPGQAQTDA